LFEDDRRHDKAPATGTIRVSASGIAISELAGRSALGTVTISAGSGALQLPDFAHVFIPKPAPAFGRYALVTDF
jgi:hypothetical protein